MYDGDTAASLTTLMRSTAWVGSGDVMVTRTSYEVPDGSMAPTVQSSWANSTSVTAAKVDGLTPVTGHANVAVSRTEPYVAVPLLVDAVASLYEHAGRAVSPLSHHSNDTWFGPATPDHSNRER